MNCAVWRERYGEALEALGGREAWREAGRG